jgi:hypothetical protein
MNSNKVRQFIGEGEKKADAGMTEPESNGQPAAIPYDTLIWSAGADHHRSWFPFKLNLIC